MTSDDFLLIVSLSLISPGNQVRLIPVRRRVQALPRTPYWIDRSNARNDISKLHLKLVDTGSLTETNLKLQRVYSKRPVHRASPASGLCQQNSFAPRRRNIGVPVSIRPLPSAGTAGRNARLVRIKTPESEAKAPGGEMEGKAAVSARDPARILL